MEELYAALYHKMFNAATDAIAALDRGAAAEARRILVTAQQNAEETYISAEAEDPTPKK